MRLTLFPLFVAVMLTGCASLRRSYELDLLAQCGDNEICDYDSPSYEFAYSVRDRDNALDLGHREHREGGQTTGQYFVLLPDGRRQIVTYRVDGKSGYRADVKYEKAYIDQIGPEYLII